MTPASSFRGKRVALFGLGGSGLSTARALVAGGAEVVVDDDRRESKERAAAEGLAVANFGGEDFSRFDTLVLTPGVPLTHPKPHWAADLARAANVEIIGDMEVFARERRALAPDAPLVAITGTNGKSTTTALVAHILREAGRDVQVGGNIGTPVLDLEPPAATRVHVLELSSFQLDLAPTFDAGIGLLLNITEDHLDRHGTMADYAAIKERLVLRSDLAILGVDDDYSRAVAERLERAGRPIERISAATRLEKGTFIAGSRVMRADGSGTAAVADLANIGTLRGRHNAQNAAAAVAAVTALGVPADALQHGLSTFPGLAHRMEQVGRLGPVLIVNDSKATNADSAAQALASFESIHWIAGGKAKTGGIGSLESFFPKIRKAYLVGESARDFAETLGPRVPHVIAGDLATALLAAAADARRSGEAEPVVLLSPACASFDQFRSFEHRGDVFRQLAHDLLAASGQREAPGQDNLPGREPQR